MSEKKENNEKKELQDRIDSLESQISKAKFWRIVNYILLLILIVNLLLEVLNPILLNSQIVPLKAASWFTISVFMMNIIQNQTSEIRQSKNTIEDIKGEIDLLNVSIHSTEARAEKQFKLHQKGLNKYYDENIRQMKGVFNLGVMSILFGTILIVFTFSTCIKNPEITETAIIPIMGVLSGLACDFIGAIFINMYTKTINASNKFHNKLVYSNNLHFANFLLSKINDENEREKATAEIAVLISKNNINDPDTNIAAEETI